MLKTKHKNTLSFILFVLPAVFIFLNVVLIPFIIGIIYSLSNWGGFAFAGSEFVGINNFIDAIGDRGFRRAFIFTFKYALVMVVAVNLLGFAFALLVNSKVLGRNVLRSIYLMPNLIGGLILGFIWRFIFSRLFVQLGMVTGLEKIFFNWLTAENSALAALLTVGIWQQAGYVMVIYLAGLQAIPGELMESASIDGATSWKKLLHIIIPLMMPSFTVNLFISMSTALKTYDINLSLTSGDPAGRTEMIAMQIYNEAFKFNNFALAQAKAVLFFIIIAVITLFQVYFTRKKEVQL